MSVHPEYGYEADIDELMEPLISEAAAPPWPRPTGVGGSGIGTLATGWLSRLTADF